MTLFENPIFLTQKRLVHREGVLAAILIAALIGLSLVSGLVAYLTSPSMFGFSSGQQAGRVFYGWTVGVEALVLVFGAFSRISRSLTEDRKAGLWDINRLTPLRPSQLVIGYWFGSGLREVYMGAALAFSGLVVVLIARLPLTLWLGTQTLLAAAVLFFGLVAVLIGLAFQRSNAGIFLVAGLACLQAFSLTQPREAITNFLLPVYGIIRLFLQPPTGIPDLDWRTLPQIFGVTVDPILLSLLLQAALGVFLWRAAIRKTAEPQQPLLRRWEAVAIFGILAVVQQSLLWDRWRGHFGGTYSDDPDYLGRFEPLLSVVHCAILLLGVLVLGLSSPQPERVRVEALRTGRGGLRLILSRSSFPLALALTALAALSLLPQFLFTLDYARFIYAVAVLNWFDCFLIFSLWLEFCRLRFRRRAIGFVVLGLFVLCILPLVLGAVFVNAAFSKLSLLAPGILVLNQPNGSDIGLALLVVLAHAAIAVLLITAWRHQWTRLLAGAQP